LRVPGSRYRSGVTLERRATAPQLLQAFILYATQGPLGTARGVLAPDASLATAGTQ
jgi:hypothetical protein